jgi:hypothetical protein
VATARFGGGFRGDGGSPPSTTPGQTFPTRPTVPSQYQAAYSTCRADLPTGGFGGGGAAVNSPAFAAYRNCLAIHGVTLPSTPPSSSGSTGTPGSGADFGSLANNPNFRAAQQACAALAPTRSTTTTVPAAA